jgi:hypothetical protein
MSEAMLEAADPEAYEATDEAWDEDTASDAYRQARQRQIMHARQAQRNASLRRAPAHGRAPSPPSRRPDLDLETKMALDTLRRRLHEANRIAYRNAWAAEASAAASQVLDSFENGLKPYDWARALIRGAPTLLLSPGKPTKPGLQGLLFDPRVGGSAALAVIFAIGHFRGATQGVDSIKIYPPNPSAAHDGGTVVLNAQPIDKKGNPVPNVTPAPSWSSSATSIVSLGTATNTDTLSTVTCTSGSGTAAAQGALITVTAGGHNASVWVSLT